MNQQAANPWTPGARLFAVCAEHWRPRDGWRAEITYVHAIDALAARAAFGVMFKRARIVAIAPPVGYFQNERGELVA